MSVPRIEILLKRYLQGVSTEQENEELFSLIPEQRGYRSLVLEGLLQFIKETEGGEGLSAHAQHNILERILQTNATSGTDTAEKGTELTIGPNTAKGKNKWEAGAVIKMNRLKYAAVWIILIAGTLYLWMNKRTGNHEEQVVQNQPDVAPGGNKAMLTLADGTTILLDSTDNGLLARQGGIRVMKLDAGALAYNGEGHTLQPNQGQLLYNTISTPRGGQYQLVLADGTKVWLNAASSLRFPVVFDEKQRKVEITGEAYFEVSENKAKPFVVVADAVKVEVLGTSFNVNAYPDEGGVSTTLVEGSVRMNAGRDIKMLMPGQQARVENGEEMEILNNVELEGITAWRKGKFIFNEMPIEKAMRQISRWYDVDISYDGKVPEQKFNGILSRDKSLSQILKVLEISQVHFKVAGNKVVVMP